MALDSDNANSSSIADKIQQIFVIIGPGILVAATGVGAGDLGAAAFSGSRLGVAVLWAILLGAFLKFVLNEGLTRWQLATGHTFLEGCMKHLGPVFRWGFLIYLLIWSFFVGLALMSACGATWHAILPVMPTAQGDKVLYGALHSILAIILVWVGGYRLFEKLMSFCVAVMFVDVVVTAIALRPSIGKVVSGLFIPQIPDIHGEGAAWTIALIGGVGGTLTIVCYGYWIQEENRTDTQSLRTCRIDLAAGYLMTAVFGMAVLIIGSQLDRLDSRGVTLLLKMSEKLREAFGSFGPVAQWAFLIGAWGAVFSSLLGVWQSIPYLFADFWEQFQRHPFKIDEQPNSLKATKIDTTSWPYRAYLLGIGLIPILGLWGIPFQQATKVNAIIGALVVPMLSLTLMILNNSSIVPRQFRNSWLTNLILSATLGFSVWIAVMTGISVFTK